MKPPAFDYAAPLTLEEALELLDQNCDRAKLLAGGQSLVPVMNLRLANPSLLIDLNRIAGLSGLSRAADGALLAGAMTRHRAFERGELVRESHFMLSHAMTLVAHAQIRNRGTVGGSLCHADPAAEWPALCLACEAEMTLASAVGSRVVPAIDFSLGVYTTAVAANEILTSVRFPPWPRGRRWGFQELSRRRGDFAIVGLIALLDFDEQEVCTRSRVVVFGASDVPVVIADAAAFLDGGRIEAAGIAKAARAARAQVQPRSDHHASAEYRSELVEVLTRRALVQAAGFNQGKA
ncbi:MAG: FAD binding domain-containing protein [Pseudomonadota bacterium]|nr:FAD binding domain-containing protein [Pseudomonadota bacterium]